MEYAFCHKGKGYLPSGTEPIPGSDVPDHNKEVEAKELAWLKTAPDKVFLYVSHEGWQGQKLGKYWSHSGQITTWTSTVLDSHCWVGSEHRDNFGGTRAAIECRIFGVRYVGWYYCSAGSYCRLRKAKKQ